MFPHRDAQEILRRPYGSLYRRRHHNRARSLSRPALPAGIAMPRSNIPPFCASKALGFFRRPRCRQLVPTKVLQMAANNRSYRHGNRFLIMRQRRFDSSQYKAFHLRQGSRRYRVPRIRLYQPEASIQNRRQVQMGCLSRQIWSRSRPTSYRVCKPQGQKHRVRPQRRCSDLLSALVH